MVTGTGTVRLWIYLSRELFKALSLTGRFKKRSANSFGIGRLNVDCQINPAHQIIFCFVCLTVTFCRQKGGTNSGLEKRNSIIQFRHQYLKSTYRIISGRGKKKDLIFGDNFFSSQDKNAWSLLVVFKSFKYPHSTFKRSYPLSLEK